MSQREIVLVLGQTGSGKTVWAKNYIGTKNRVIILDAGFDEYNCHSVSTFQELVGYVSGKSFFRVSYSPMSYEYPLMFDLARIVGNCHLLIEEADRLDDPRTFFEYDEAISRGRHYGVSLIAVSFYPAKIPAMLRRQTTRLISFRQIEPRDLDYIAEIIGDLAYDLPNLEKFQYVEWTPLEGAKIKGGQKSPTENMFVKKHVNTLGEVGMRNYTREELQNDDGRNEKDILSGNRNDPKNEP